MKIIVLDPQLLLLTKYLSIPPLCHRLLEGGRAAFGYVMLMMSCREIFLNNFYPSSSNKWFFYCCRNLRSCSHQNHNLRWYLELELRVEWNAIIQHAHDIDEIYIEGEKNWQFYTIWQLQGREANELGGRGRETEDSAGKKKDGKTQNLEKTFPPKTDDNLLLRKSFRCVCRSKLDAISEWSKHYFWMFAEI